MKTPLCLIACLALASSFLNVAAAEETTGNTGNDAAAVAPAATSTVNSDSAPVAPPLAPGVADIAKMAQAKVGDSIILAYINNSGTVYNLDPAQIVYLRDVGTSETVISAMLNQRQKYTEQAQAANPPAPAPPLASPSPTDYSQPQSDATYVQSAPAPEPVSTVYVIPSGVSYGCYSGYHYNFYPAYFPSCYNRYPVYYNGFACGGYHSSGVVVGFHAAPQHFVSGSFHASSGFHNHH
jgi:hypothetical protein